MGFILMGYGWETTDGCSSLSLINAISGGGWEGVGGM